MKDYPLYIALDGIDGCGKTTLSQGIYKEFAKLGRRVKLTREPGGTEVGMLLRQLLVNQKFALEPETELMLYCADRLEHQTKLVLPNLESGRDVISDRFLSSTYAYQIFGRGLDKPFLDYLSQHSVKRMPDITFIIDIDPKTALNRAVERLKRDGMMQDEGKFESLGTEFYEKVHEGFVWYADTHENVWTINGMQPKEAVLADVMAILDNFV
ncbi:dTMP kinase [Seleniivibrio woodruffii]|uniref:dTMP kinase n=1 Tax=Seleniivibrio woodruffii TaxID=1078050 RepID=UPI002409688E|nr:dTMP kinase [Seleniivibrio woodruffii]